jgi:hypothetical protein
MLIKFGLSEAKPNGRQRFAKQTARAKFRLGTGPPPRAKLDSGSGLPVTTDRRKRREPQREFRGHSS